MGAYDLAGLHPERTPAGELLRHARDADVVFASTLPRAIQTAEMPSPAAAQIITDPVFVEAPLPPPALVRQAQPARLGRAGRASSWWFGAHADGESRQRGRAPRRGRRRHAHRPRAPRARTCCSAPMAGSTA